MSNGHERWWPDKYTAKKRELLDPNKTPRENLWDFVYKVTCVWLNKARVWAYSEQDMSELESETRMATYLRLRYLVRTRQYQRKYSFWVNCTRACYSVYNACITAWLRRLKPRAMEVCGDDLVGSSDNSATLFDMVSFAPVWLTESDYLSRQKMPWNAATRPYDRWRKLHEHADDLYSLYCEDCLELGVTPVDKIKFVMDNFTKEEQDFMHENKTVSSATATYLRNWYEKKKKTDPQWWARRLKKQKEYSERNRQKRKEWYKERYQRIKAKKQQKGS